MAKAKTSRAPRGAALTSEQPSARALGYRMPAEWEPHAATWLSWPHEASDWPGKFSAVPWVFAEIARKLVPGERIRLLVSGRAMKKQALAALASAGVDVAHVDCVLSSTNRSWTRDFVPSFVVSERGPRPRRGRRAGH